MESSMAVVGNNLEPQDEMEFESHEAAYEFYKEYAKSVGFGTAKLSSRRSRASKEFIAAKFSCIRYGNKQQSDDAINPRPSPKIGCKASMHVKRKQNGKWYIHSFMREHNHDLLPAQVHLFRSHRISDPIKSDPKIRRRRVLSTVPNQYATYQISSSFDNIFTNQHGRGRSLALEEGDAQMLLERFVHMQEETPGFFYAVDMNEEHRLRNVFWVDAKGMDDYANFRDVISFDISYFTNKYRIPMVYFVGVNNHIQPILLGCALIADESVHTFFWLFKTWCLAMGGRGPDVLLTDQNLAIKAAVSAALPNTHHYFSLWCVLEKIPRHLDYLSLWHDLFIAKFSKCIHRSRDEEQFEKRWWKLLDRFSLRDVEWIQSLYEDRKQWVPTFMKGISFAGLSTASRAESMNSLLDKYIHSDTSLREFMGKYKLTLEDRYEEEAKANFDAWHETAELNSPSPFEKQLSQIYTHEIFKKFQVEVLGAAACHLKKEKGDMTMTYAVKDFETDLDYSVEWTESNLEIYCSCHLFEYKGFLCRHAIVVLQMSGIFKIPVKYVLQRWTNVAKSRICISENLDDVQSKVRRYNDLCRRAIILGEEGSLSLESYNIAVGAIKEAMEQCSNVNGFTNVDLRHGMLSTHVIQGIEEANHKSTVLAKEHVSDIEVSPTSRGSKRVDSWNEQEGNGSHANKKGKGPLEVDASNISTQAVSNQMDMCSNLECHTFCPRFLTTLLTSGEGNKRSVELLGEMFEEQS
ncbi:unnamed protein product [Cuscuta europaea]|uniref:Protein FAR1-RELATED SEQUENCE n=1 Tax=Cuscuta europaea TaxID=41803 RepID=A0A9P1E1E8_CUSEU|nr:unnamed protein product [Cuscuta europaea]